MTNLTVWRFQYFFFFLTREKWHQSKTCRYRLELKCAEKKKPFRRATLRLKPLQEGLLGGKKCFSAPSFSFPTSLLMMVQSQAEASARLLYYAGAAQLMARLNKAACLHHAKGSENIPLEESHVWGKRGKSFTGRFGQ